MRRDDMGRVTHGVFLLDTDRGQEGRLLSDSFIPEVLGLKLLSRIELLQFQMPGAFLCQHEPWPIKVDVLTIDQLMAASQS